LKLIHPGRPWRSPYARTPLGQLTSLRPRGEDIYIYIYMYTKKKIEAKMNSTLVEGKESSLENPA